MKDRLLLLLSAILFVTSLSAGGHAYDGTTFTISSNVSLPVHVRFGGKEITISSYQYTTYTRISNATITDAHGNNCIYRHTYDSHSGSDGSYVHHYYNITGVYSSSNSSSSNSSDSWRDHSNLYIPKKDKEKEERTPYVWDESNMPYFYPNLHLRLGFSPL